MKRIAMLLVVLLGIIGNLAAQGLTPDAAKNFLVGKGRLNQTDSVVSVESREFSGYVNTREGIYSLPESQKSALRDLADSEKKVGQVLVFTITHTPVRVDGTKEGLEADASNMALVDIRINDIESVVETTGVTYEFHSSLRNFNRPTVFVNVVSVKRFLIQASTCDGITLAQVDSAISARSKAEESKFDTTKRYLVVSPGLAGALVDGSKNDPFGLHLSFEVELMNAAIEFSGTFNDLEEGHGGVSAGIGFVKNEFVYGIEYTVFGNYEKFPWKRHPKHLAFSFGRKFHTTVLGVPVVITPTVQLSSRLIWGDEGDPNGTIKLIGIHPGVGVKATVPIKALQIGEVIRKITN